MLGEFRTPSIPRFTNDLGQVDERVMEAVEIGLRAVFDLQSAPGRGPPRREP
ncbi:hypothetical protein [Streptomyces sp. NPDC127066]|uniref:hypothetical protein n=1 Tax=Streptomyces sp. NPDC127066 TaxID=3347125 RepID=UPI00365E0E6A